MPNTRGQYTPLFEDRSYENILEEAMTTISPGTDKREGSVTWDALAPMSIEVSLLYSYLDFLFKNAFGDTANRYWLIQRAKERGLEIKGATKAVIVGKFNAELSLQDRFSIDGIYYSVTKFVEEKDSFFYYMLECESAGSIGNKEAGMLTPAQNIRGLSLSEIHKLAIFGEDEEDTEAFRERYFESIKTIAYGGNISDYKNKVMAIDGVGLVKVIPVWNGGGTVKLIITDPLYGEATSELVSTVQEIVDPIPYNQKGVGIAPIGHYVTVVSAKRKPVDIYCSLQLNVGADIETVKKHIRDGIEAYFANARSNWDKILDKNVLNYEGHTGGLYVENDIRLTKIMSIILNVPDVVDFTDIRFVGSDGKILVLNEEEIPYLGNLEIVSVVP